MPVIVSAEKNISPELAQSLTKLYDSSPEFSDGAEAIDKANDILSDDGVLYVGWFNGKAAQQHNVYYTILWCILLIEAGALLTV